MSPKRSTEPSAATPPAEDPDAAATSRLAAIYADAHRHYSSFGIQVTDTGGNTEFDLAQMKEVISVIREAGDQVQGLLGFEKGSGRDLGSYGVVYHGGGIPPEYEVEYESNLRFYKEALFAWQNKCANYRASQAVIAELEAQRAAAEAAAKKTGEGRRRKRKPTAKPEATTGEQGEQS